MRVSAKSDANAAAREETKVAAATLDGETVAALASCFARTVATGGCVLCAYGLMCVPACVRRGARAPCVCESA
eukprot:6182460-Pleurochrysis_carterae.AAC.1